MKPVPRSEGVTDPFPDNYKAWIQLGGRFRILSAPPPTFYTLLNGY